MEQKDIDAIYKELTEKIDAINKKINSNEPTEKWLTNNELMQLLKISNRTAMHYRDSGLLSFSQVGGKVYYKLSDVEELLNSQYQKK